jgi:hypothetical protein
MALYRFTKEDLNPKKKESRINKKALLMPAAGLLIYLVIVGIATTQQRKVSTVNNKTAEPARQEETPIKEDSANPPESVEPSYKCYWEEGGSDYFITSDSKSCKESLANIEEQRKKPFYTEAQCKKARADLARAERDRRNYEVGAYASGVQLDGWGAQADYSIYKREKEDAERILYYCK